MTFIVEAVISAAITVLFEKLASSDLLQFAREQQIHGDLNKWKTILVKIQAVLDDAEEKQTTNKLVEIWLGELKNLAYDLEDILDVFATQALRRELLDEPQASRSKVRKLVSTCYTGLINPRSRKLNSAMASQIKEITTRFEDILQQKKSLHLKENPGVKSNQARYERPPTTHLNEPLIYGREKDQVAMIQLLLNDDVADANFSVISVEGMGGLGKTTLAQLVYNHHSIKNHFDIKAWICVSEDFDVVRITKTILKSIGSDTNNVDDLSKLHEELEEKLSRKKFFLVLDDVWNENYEKWTNFCLPFATVSRGSKILVTTRHHSVSLKAGACVAYPLKELSNDECLSILTNHSLLERDPNRFQNLKSIVQEMAKRCAGVPLAAKTLGGLLRGKVEYKEWENVLNSNTWTLLEEESGMVPALKVSYYYLPSHLKRCFGYCSLFPKDYVFRKEELVLLWMSEGFLQTKGSRRQPEDLGEEYFDDLHSRSFFQQSSDGASFVMHDLINDLAQWAVKDFYFRIDNLSQGEKHLSIPKNLHHLSDLDDGSYYYYSEMFETLNEMKGLRTFITNFRFQNLCHNFSDKLVQLQRLRVLSLKRYSTPELPDKISNLNLLRHLDLSYSRIKILPDSINTLQNLEVLILEPCDYLKRLCSNMGNLSKLRHFYISAESLETMPLGIGQLTTLRTLTQFVVGERTDSGLGDLKDLKDLQGRLHICRLENVNDPKDAERANLNGKRGLKDLQLRWTSYRAGSDRKEIATQVLDNLQPCQKLENLGIRGYCGTRFPKWLGDNSLSSLKCLTISEGNVPVPFPSIGKLTSLEKLRMESLKEITMLGPEFYGHGSTPFPSLKELYIRGLHNWANWVPCAQAFGQLRQFHISDCPKLQGVLPHCLPSLESLSINYCKQLNVTLPNLPKHCTVEIDGCRQIELRSVEGCSSLSSMVHMFFGISSYILLAERSSEVEKLDVAVYDRNQPSLSINFNSKSVRSMFTAQMSTDAFSFLEEEIEQEQQQQQELPRVQYLILKDCNPEKLGEALQRLSFLRGLFISESPNLISFPEADLPSNLRLIIIHGCRALQSLPKAWIHSTSNTYLDNLYILNCESLKYIARVQLKLKRLKIKRCSKLLTVLDEEEVSGTCSMSNPCLESLKIEDCPSLTYLCSNSNDLPGTIQDISLQDCSDLVSLASRGNLPKDLRYLHMSLCSKLTSIAESFHDDMKLERLYISGSQGLDTLPSGIGNLKSLQSLSINNCLGLESIPDGGFPTSLTSLSVSGMKMCKSLFEWGLHRLVSLRELYISGGRGVMSFPQEETGMVLPPSLMTLSVTRFANLKRLSSIAECLTCLEKLYLISCPILEFFPENGLPNSLKELKIMDCPLLEERCKNNEEWWMISQIPKVEIRDTLFFSPIRELNSV